MITVRTVQREPQQYGAFEGFVLYNVSVNSKLDHPPRAKPPSDFFDGRIPHPRAKKEFKTPTPGPMKTS